MLQALFRAATLALLAAVAVLIYVNYFRASDALTASSAELPAVETPPELPKLAPNPEPQVASPAQPAAAIGAPVRANAENAPATAASIAAERAKMVSESANMALAEVVELPSSSTRHAVSIGNGLTQSQAAPTAAQGKRTHVVLQGESLWVISRKYFGSAEHISKIAASNGITSHDRIRAGQILVIPDLNAPVASAPRPAPLAPEDEADHEDAARATPVVLNRTANQPAPASSQSPKRY